MGHVHEDIFVITSIRSSLMDCFARGFSFIVVDLNEQIMEKILKEGLLSIEAKTRWKDKRVYLIPHKTYKEDCFSVRGEASIPNNLPEKAQLLY